MKKLTLAKLMLLFMVGGLSILQVSCKKEIVEEKSNISYDIPNKKNILKYLSVTLQVPEDSIRIDNKTYDFYVPNSVFRENISVIESRYNTANEYKFTYEK